MRRDLSGICNQEIEELRKISNDFHNIAPTIEDVIVRKLDECDAEMKIALSQQIPQMTESIVHQIKQTVSSTEFLQTACSDFAGGTNSGPFDRSYQSAGPDAECMRCCFLLG